MNKSDVNIADGRIFLWHSLVLLAGFLLGMAAAYLFAGIQFDHSAELNRARELGIVSKTILMRYGKQRDILNYLALTGFPIVFGLGAWFFWSGRDRRETLAALFQQEVTITSYRVSWRWLAFAAALYLLFSFDVNNFYRPSFNTFVGAWPLLGEEGENLAWVQSIRNGGVYGRDFHCLYGPMLIYPMAWFMELFGTTVVAARQYTYLLNLAGYAIVLVFLARTLRSRWGFVFAAAAYFLIFRSDSLLSPNESYLRVALGLVPILLLYLYQERRSRWTVAGAGAVLGQSLLFSQEVGICSLIAALVMLALIPRERGALRGAAADAGLLACGAAASVLPMLSYFAYHGALPAFLDTLLVHPRLLGLGFCAIPFSDIREFLSAPWSSKLLFHYWVIFVYIGAALVLGTLVLMGRRDRDTLLRVALLAFGGILYRAALSRSDAYHVFFVSPPAFLLTFLFLDDIIRAGLRRGFSGVAAARGMAGLLLLGSLLLLSLNSTYVDIWGNAARHLSSLPRKFKVVPEGVAVPALERGGIYYDAATAASLQKIGTFLNRHTRSGEHVFFFPNEAAYYFLFDRNNPTRYVISYFAVTRDQRLELVADLEKNRPRYAVYSRETWRVDKIPERVQVPEVCDYLLKEYSILEDHGDVVFLQRNRL